MKCLKMSKVWILMQMNATYRPYKTQTDNIFLKKYQAIWKQERIGEWLKRTDHSYPERLLIQENVNWVQWHTHVIPVLWEDKAGQYLMSASPMQFSDLVNSTSKNKKRTRVAQYEVTGFNTQYCRERDTQTDGQKDRNASVIRKGPDNSVCYQYYICQTKHLHGSNSVI